MSVFKVYLAREVLSWSCMEIDYTESYWGRKFLSITYLYYILKVADLLDTVSSIFHKKTKLSVGCFKVFFVLKKKTTHVSFLHIYHHFGMVCITWLATKFLGGGHNYYVGVANAPVHIILYTYYLLTAYDSKYSKVLWLKKLITQSQLVR